MGTDSLYYIMDYSGHYYRTDKSDQLVAVAGEQDATVFTFAQANSRILCKFFNKKAFALECYFRYNNPSISLQKGQTFLPTAKLVDYILRSQPFFMTIECSQSVHSIVYERIFYGRKHNV